MRAAPRSSLMALVVCLSVLIGAGHGYAQSPPPAASKSATTKSKTKITKIKPAPSAEGEEGDEAAEASGDETTSSATVTDEGETASAEGEAPNNAPESYTVQPGDTLWNLSQRFLNNPWYWPKIWSYNPKLENPNWIRPGSVLRFYPSGDETAVAVNEKPKDDEDDEGGGDEGFEDIPLFELGSGAEARLKQLRDLEGAKRRREFFIPKERIGDQGVIQNSPEEKEMLSIYDGAYVKVPSAHVGDRLQIYRQGREIKNPVTGESVGRIVTILGELDVETVGKDHSLARISASWDEIERGDWVSKLPPQADGRVVPAKNVRTVRGYLVDAAPSELHAFGEQYLVVLDKGTADGVKMGNTFTAVRGGDPYTRQTTGLLDEDLGEIMVLDAFEHASTGLVMHSNRELLPGDRVEMRQQQ